LRAILKRHLLELFTLIVGYGQYLIVIVRRYECGSRAVRYRNEKCDAVT